MKQTIGALLIMVLLLFSCNPVQAQTMLFHESFDQDTNSGVIGHARLFDGYFTESVYGPDRIEEPKGGFTIEAWIAPQEFALNTAAIVDREKDLAAGYLLGLDNYGHLVGAVSVDGEWKTCVSTQALSILKWSQVVMTVSPDKGIQLFINALKVGELAFSGKLSLCPDCRLSIGKTQTKLQPINTERASSQLVKVENRFDGLIDEVSLMEGAMDAKSILSRFKAVNIQQLQPLTYRKMPSGDGEKGPFGAYYCRLKYSPGWDALWRGSDFPDIVVRFADNPVRFVFWRGTGYIPAVVSENGIWMSDQSLENWGLGECYEAMGDKQTHYSQVRIIENTPARCVIHWRYALASIKHAILNEDESGWGDWTDEYWTIYPDGVAVRKQVLWSRNYSHDFGNYQFQETIFFNQPGTRPQDNVENEAITFCDMEGNKATYSWEHAIPKKFEQPACQPLQLINFKSQYKPYSIYDPKRITRPFWFGAMADYSVFPCWNHWPVQQTASDGRNVVFSDKPSHTSLTESNGQIQIVEKGKDDSFFASSLIGMTTQPIESLLPLARSWNYAPLMKNLSAGFQYAGYDKYQRAYLLKSDQTNSKRLDFQVEASEASPVQNMALVIDNWNLAKAKVKVNDRWLDESEVTSGRVDGLDQNKTILFIKYQSVSPLKISIHSN